MNTQDNKHMENLKSDIQKVLDDDFESPLDLKSLANLLRLRKGLSPSSNNDLTNDQKIIIVKENINILSMEGLEKSDAMGAINNLLKLKNIGIINLSMLLHSAFPKVYPLYSKDMYDLLVYLDYFNKASNEQERYTDYSDCLSKILKNHIDTLSSFESSLETMYTKISFQIKVFEITEFLE